MDIAQARKHYKAVCLIIGCVKRSETQYSVCCSRELTSSVFKQNLVVEAQAQLGHPREEDAHLDGANNLTAQDVAVGTDLEHRWISRVGRENSPRATGHTAS